MAAAIRSALAQTYLHTQIIVIDDGSTDDTQVEIAGWEGVEYYYQPNAGQAAARNAGLRHCRGDYIASLDSDDTWNPDFLAASVAMLQKHHLDFVFLNWQASNNHNGFLNFFALPGKEEQYCRQVDAEWWLLDAVQTRQLFVETCPAPSSSLVVRRTSLQPGAWNEEMLIADDWCLVLDMVLAGPRRAAFTLQPRWLKQVHAGNIYDGRDQLAVIRELGFHDEKLLAARFSRQLSAGERSVFRHRLAEHYFSFAYYSWKRTAPAQTILWHLGLAFLLAPLVIFRSSVGSALGRLKKQWPRGARRN